MKNLFVKRLSLLINKQLGIGMRDEGWGMEDGGWRI
jgi:hypothetical protein